MKNSFYEIFMDLPLFKGVSRATVSELAGKFKLDFKKYGPGESIVRAGEECNSLIFVISGETECVRQISGDRAERRTLPAGVALYPEYLFGLSTTYPADVRALQNVGTMEISKADYLDILNGYRIPLLNYINYLARMAQQSGAK